MLYVLAGFGVLCVVSILECLVWLIYDFIFDDEGIVGVIATNAFVITILLMEIFSKYIS